jgi:pyridoxal biosynthesis lyase PdxS
VSTVDAANGAGAAAAGRSGEQVKETGTVRVKRGMAEMLKGGVIMDVVTAEQAKIAEDAGAVAVMALERVPADIRAQGGVARMSDPDMIEAIMGAVSVPVMAKCRIGHFAEAQVLQAIGVDYIDESEVLTPADEAHHVDKWAFTVPFVCGAVSLGEALRRLAEGAAMIRSKGEAGTGNVVEATRHMRARPAGSAAWRPCRPGSCSPPPGSCRRPMSWSPRWPARGGCRSCCLSPAASPPPPTPR